MSNYRVILDLTTSLNPADVRARLEQSSDPAIIVNGVSVICAEGREVQQALGREDGVKLVADGILMFCAPGLEYTRTMHEDGTEELDLEGGIHIEISTATNERMEMVNLGLMAHESAGGHAANPRHKPYGR